MSDPRQSLPSKLSRSAFLKAQLRTWHWISSAVCLAGLMLFAITGFTLNHAASIEAKPETVTRELTLPAAVLAQLARAQNGKPLDDATAVAVKTATGANVVGREVEAADGEVTVDLQGPGVDSYVTVDLDTGEATYERTHRGTIAVLNDLHKGRDTGPAWSWFIDIIAIACVVFAATGLGLLWVHSRGRAWTWPLTTAGFVVPVILFLIFIHS